MEHIILSWLQSHMSMIATWVIGLPAIAILIKKYFPKIRRFIKIGREAMDVIDSAMDALSDNPVKEEKIQIVLKEINDFKEALK